MSHYRRDATPGSTWFFTVVTHQRRPLLCQESFRSALRQATEATRARYPFTVDAWVLLPDHMHCVWTLPDDDAEFSRRWSLIKKQVSWICGQRDPARMVLSESRHRKREAAIWQRRFWEHRIRDAVDYQRHVDYIHGNPLRHGLVTRVRDWPYSTFHRYVREGVYAPDWAGAMEEMDCE